MTYKQFKQTMNDIQQGIDEIYIGETGPYTNKDAREKMALLIDLVPNEYCARLLEETA
jgi:hypothetical protein